MNFVYSFQRFYSWMQRDSLSRTPKTIRKLLTCLWVYTGEHDTRQLSNEQSFFLLFFLYKSQLSNKKLCFVHKKKKKSTKKLLHSFFFVFVIKGTKLHNNFFHHFFAKNFCRGFFTFFCVLRLKVKRKGRKMWERKKRVLLESWIITVDEHEGRKWLEAF